VKLKYVGISLDGAQLKHDKLRVTAGRSSPRLPPSITAASAA